MNDPYIILGVSPLASEEEVKIAYQTLKTKYSNERFTSGEVGNNAAKNLAQLEEAFYEIQNNFVKARAFNEQGGKYYEVEKALKNSNVAQAQNLLDMISERDAEWHYFQAIIFYKKNWFGESKRQLEYALKIEPNNTKYQQSYDKLSNLMNNPQNNGSYFTGANSTNASPQPEQMGNGCGPETDCCLSLLCANCCCSLLGGGC